MKTAKFTKADPSISDISVTVIETMSQSAIDKIPRYVLAAAIRVVWDWVKSDARNQHDLLETDLATLSFLQAQFSEAEQDQMGDDGYNVWLPKQEEEVAVEVVGLPSSEQILSGKCVVCGKTH